MIVHVSSCARLFALYIVHATQLDLLCCINIYSSRSSNSESSYHIQIHLHHCLEKSLLSLLWVISLLPDTADIYGNFVWNTIHFHEFIDCFPFTCLSELYSPSNQLEPENRSAS